MFDIILRHSKEESRTLSQSNDNSNLLPPSQSVLHPQLSICTCLITPNVAMTVTELLGGYPYVLTQQGLTEETPQFLERERQQLDCLIVEDAPDTLVLLRKLQEKSLLLPVVILENGESLLINTDLSDSPSSEVSWPILYHNAEVHVPIGQLQRLKYYIDQAITQFLNLSVATYLTEPVEDAPTELTNFIMRQQRRLVEKLRERLGYLGVYYKRNPRSFWRNLSPGERQILLGQLQESYRQIALHYFSNEESLNSLIDDFVNMAFFADVPVTQIVEIHMELIDNFSKQLRLEGRSEEVLLDYRLTLIDTIAHLCEMYRRSIPRES